MACMRPTTQLQNKVAANFSKSTNLNKIMTLKRFCKVHFSLFAICHFTYYYNMRPCQNMRGCWEHALLHCLIDCYIQNLGKTRNGLYFVSRNIMHCSCTCSCRFQVVHRVRQQHWMHYSIVTLSTNWEAMFFSLCMYWPFGTSIIIMNTCRAHNPVVLTALSALTE